MNDLKFNIYAMTKPQTQEEYSALLDEAIRMGEELNGMWEEIFRLARKNNGDVV